MRPTEAWLKFSRGCRMDTMRTLKPWRSSSSISLEINVSEIRGYPLSTITSTGFAVIVVPYPR